MNEDSQLVKDLYKYAYHETRDEGKLQELLKDYPTNSEVREAVKCLQGKSEVKNTIYMNVPSADVSKFNLKPKKYPKLDTSHIRAPDSVFETINDFNSKSHTDQEFDSMYNYILTNACYTKAHRNGNAIVSIMFVVKLMSHYKNDMDIILDKYPKCLNLLNTCLFHMEDGINIATDNRLRIIGHRFIELGLAKYIWVPSK